MNILEKSLIDHFVELGSSQQNAAITYQIYLELTENRKLHDVNYYFNKDLNRMYLTARKSKAAAESLYFPISSSEEFSLKFLIEMFESIGKSINLAVMSSDSTTVIYEISNGIKEK